MGHDIIMQRVRCGVCKVKHEGDEAGLCRFIIDTVWKWFSFLRNFRLRNLCAFHVVFVDGKEDTFVA